ncbi:hypothetical protein DSECCO2_645440 [anaerobic digester metagenome]
MIKYWNDPEGVKFQLSATVPVIGLLNTAVRSVGALNGVPDTVMLTGITMVPTLGLEVKVISAVFTAPDESPEALNSTGRS